VVEQVDALIQDFQNACASVGLRCGAVTPEAQHAPHHKPHGLPSGKVAVYVFSLSASYGSRCPAGAHRTLKVGKARPGSNKRFRYQHYNGGAVSTLQGSLLKGRILWPYLGIASLAERDVRKWILRNTDRDNFYLDAADEKVLPELERFIRAKLGPAFEGG
jgi:hypothetical protein